MRHLIAAVRQASHDRNPYAALSLALTLPDICASLESDDGKTNGAKYAEWWDLYLGPTYTHPIGYPPRVHVFMTGGDCYALRCAVLHQGLDDISFHKVRDALEKFHLVQPHDPRTLIHRNQSGNALNLQVNVFCEEICQGVEAWLDAMSGQASIAAQLAQLMTIDDLSGGWRM